MACLLNDHYELHTEYFVRLYIMQNNSSANILDVEVIIRKQQPTLPYHDVAQLL